MITCTIFRGLKLPKSEADTVWMQAPLRTPGSESPCTAVTGAHSVLYVTYSASNLHQRAGSATYRKLRQIVADFATKERPQSQQPHLPSPIYRLELLYQRSYSHEPFNCSLHVPAGSGCDDITRQEIKRAFGNDMALHRPQNAPRRLNIGFWVMALWMMRRQEAGRSDRGGFVWYLEDDIYLPGSWSRFLRRYDTTHRNADLLVAQPPYRLEASDLALVHGTAHSPQLSIPKPTLARRLPVMHDRQYAKVPLYTWRMHDRLANAVASALRRGARAHEEFLVPTVCEVTLRAPRCSWEAMALTDVGIPCGANRGDAWNRAREVGALAARNRTEFEEWVQRLQAPGGTKLLQKTPQRIHHPVKGQIAVNWDLVRKRMGRTP